MIIHQVPVTGTDRKVGIVVSRFNELVTRELLAGARSSLIEHGVSDDDITVAWVPGAWEIPAVLRRMARGGRFDALIGLGAVIRGDTAHFDFVAGGAADGSMAVAMEFDIPVVFGVLTTENLEQALERAGMHPNSIPTDNKGWESALTALEMANLFDRLGE
ncbi:MAG: 6,7-dimethyl-8-ribityllumazine synthase [Gemmatimonadota bacterium]|jgi:6,7-dimethyl-8-ribityllumazine synthase|nr:6,7-dimethyl-8-ribityllumazine synthase [Gemmatimonadota bacterium]